MTMLTCKRSLATIWLTLGGLAVLVLLGQTVTDRYGDKLVDVWTWFTIYFLPAATIVMFASTVGDRDSPSNASLVSPGAFFGAAVLSLLYLLMILIPLLSQPFLESESPFDTLNKWAIVLAIFQSIVIGALAAVYIRP